MKPVHPIPWAYQGSSSLAVDADGGFVFCGHDVEDDEFVLHAVNMHQKLVHAIRGFIYAESQYALDSDVVYSRAYREAMAVLKEAEEGGEPNVPG